MDKTLQTKPWINSIETKARRRVWATRSTPSDSLSRTSSMAFMGKRVITLLQQFKRLLDQVSARNSIIPKY
ncbi:hypothetical protein N9B31_00400 [Mariniblastus sp.]|nr:hypothetical protein [Mariniblastus sp.]